MLLLGAYLTYIVMLVTNKRLNIKNHNFSQIANTRMLVTTTSSTTTHKTYITYYFYSTLFATEIQFEHGK